MNTQVATAADDPETRFDIRGPYKLVPAGNIHLSAFGTNSEESFELSSVTSSKTRLQKVFNMKATFLTNKIYNLTELIREFRSSEPQLQFDQTKLDAQGSRRRPLLIAR